MLNCDKNRVKRLEDGKKNVEIIRNITEINLKIEKNFLNFSKISKNMHKIVKLLKNGKNVCKCNQNSVEWLESYEKHWNFPKHYKNELNYWKDDEKKNIMKISLKIEKKYYKF